MSVDARVGVKIKEARERSGKTQTQFGKELGVGIRTVQRWENGDRLDLPVLRKIASNLGTSLNGLLGGEPVSDVLERMADRVAEPSTPYGSPATVDQLTQIVATLTRLVETGQEQQARLLDQQDKLLARLEESQRHLGAALGLKEPERDEPRRKPAAGGTSGHPGRSEGRAAS